jgi:hypothetical protein
MSFTVRQNLMKTPLLLSLLLVDQLSAQKMTVFIIQPIANPQKYDGKIVRFERVTNIELEGNGAYLSKAHWKADVQSFAILKDLGDGLTKGRKWLNRKHCIIEGIFHATDRGHMELNMGSLSNLTMFNTREPINSDEAKKLQKSRTTKELHQPTGNLLFEFGLL